MTATTFTEAQVRRAVKGAMDAGMSVGVVEITKDGTIRLLPKQDESRKPADERKPEPW